MKTIEILSANGMGNEVTNKEMLFFGMQYIADKYGIKFEGEDYDDLQMVNLRGAISKECYYDVKELAMDLRLIDAEHECKMSCSKEYGISLIFDEHWDRRVGNKEFGATICKWYDKVA
jgi:hypothetical protein